jgi:hypothetical protein
MRDYYGDEVKGLPPPIDGSGRECGEVAQARIGIPDYLKKVTRAFATELDRAGFVDTMGEGFAELLWEEDETETELRRKQRKLVAEAFRSALRAIEKGDKYKEEEEEEEDSDEEGNDFDDSDGSNAGDKVGRCLDFSYTSPLSPRLTLFYQRNHILLFVCLLRRCEALAVQRIHMCERLRGAVARAVELATKANQCAASVETSLMEIIRARTQAEHRSVANMAKQVTRVA